MFDLDEIRSNVKNAVQDSVSNLLYYDRKEDEDLTIEDIKYFLKNDPEAVAFILSTYKETLVKKTKELF
jgi:hypothetical protein